MSVPPNHGAKLGNGNKAGKIVYFSLGVAPRFFEAAEIEKFGAIMYLCPEALCLRERWGEELRMSERGERSDASENEKKEKGTIEVRQRAQEREPERERKKRGKCK